MHDLFPLENPVLVFATVALLILLAPVVMGRWRLPGTAGLLLLADAIDHLPTVA